MLCSSRRHWQPAQQASIVPETTELPVKTLSRKRVGVGGHLTSLLVLPGGMLVFKGVGG